MAVSGILVPLGGILRFSVRDSFIPSFANGISPRQHILLLSTREEKNPISDTSCNRKNSLRFYGGRGDMMFLLVFGFYLCVCGCAGLYVCGRV